MGALTFPTLSGEPVWVRQFAGVGASRCHRSTRHVIYHHSQCHFTRSKFSGCWRCVSSCPPFRLALWSWMDRRFDRTLCGAWRNWLLIFLRHFLQWKVCCAFHWTAQMFSFSQLAPSHCARIKMKFQGRLHRLLFSGFFACLRWINFYHFEKLLKVHWPVYLINQCIKPPKYVFFYLLTLFLLSRSAPPLFFLSVWSLRIYLMHRGSRICISENFREILCR